MATHETNTRIFHRTYGTGSVISTAPFRPEGDTLLIRWDNPVQAQSDQDWIRPDSVEIAILTYRGSTDRLASR